VWEQPVVLGHIPDPPILGCEVESARRIEPGHSAEGDVTLGRMLEAGDCAQQ
jgi:hypothetical protein